jgi:hypothetical protein
MSQPTLGTPDGIGATNRQDNDGYLQRIENRLSERTLSEPNGTNKLRCGKGLSPDASSETQPQYGFGDQRGNASHTTNHRSRMPVDRTWLLSATESYQTTWWRTDHDHSIREKCKDLFNAKVHQTWLPQQVRPLKSEIRKCEIAKCDLLKYINF